MELKPNDKVTLTIGTTATVVKELGRGGQGIVYLVDLAGQKMALKWYHNPPSDAFYNYLLARKNFKSFNAMMAAAMKVCNGFMMLHRFGYSYQDLNDGNFFIRPTDGDVLICDNDNVMAQGEKSGIMGKARYMAPEIVAGGTPDKQFE